MRHVLNNSMGFLFLLVLFRVIFRKAGLAIGIMVALLAALSSLTADHVLINFAFTAIILAVVSLLLVRFGLVSAMAATFVGQEIIYGFPLTMDFSTWYAGSSLLALAVGAALMIYGFTISTGGRPIPVEAAAEA